MNGDPVIFSIGMTLDQLEKLAILKTLNHFRSKPATASALGIALRTLDNKLARYNAEEKTQQDLEELNKAKREHELARARGEIPPSSIYANGRKTN